MLTNLSFFLGHLTTFYVFDFGQTDHINLLCAICGVNIVMIVTTNLMWTMYVWVNWWAKGGVAYLVIYDWSSNHFLVLI